MIQILSRANSIADPNNLHLIIALRKNVPGWNQEQL